MKKIYLLILAGIGVFASCKKDNSVKMNNPMGNKKLDTLQGSITKDMTLDPSKNYFLKGQVSVKNNATLTIPAGITVYAQANAERSAKSVLMITQGSKLNINGSVDNPVVFTSAAATKAPGDWDLLRTNPHIGTTPFLGSHENQETDHLPAPKKTLLLPPST